MASELIPVNLKDLTCPGRLLPACGEGPGCVLSKFPSTLPRCVLCTRKERREEGQAEECFKVAGVGWVPTRLCPSSRAPGAGAGAGFGAQLTILCLVFPS